MAGPIVARPIAFVCAMPVEMKAIAQQLSLSRTQRDGVDLRVGRLGDREVVAIVTGMGTALAGAATRRLLDVVDVERVVVAGISGGVDDVTPIGTVVVPEVVVNSNSGAEHRPTPLGDHTPRGTLWTTDVMASPTELAGLRARGVVALDMETAAVAGACEERGVTWSVIRVISDGPADEVDDEVFRLSNQDGTPNVANIVRYVVRRPGRVPRLVRMGRNVQMATGRAAEVAIAALW